MAITYTILDTLDEIDAIDARDITGNGLPDLLAGREDNGYAYWYEQTERGTFVRHTISEASLGTGWEGAVWIDIDNDGQYEAVFTDQDNSGGHWIFKPDTSDYTGTWSGSKFTGVIVSTQDLLAWDIDDDGVEELVYTWQGHTDLLPGDGGVAYLKYVSGDVFASGSYTTSVMKQMDEAWWMSERVDLSGDGSRDNLVIGCRNSRTPTTVGKIAWIRPNGAVTNTWIETPVETADEDWLHVHVGNFHGNGDKDIMAQNYDGELAVYDFNNSWAKTVIVSAQDKAMFNAIPMPSYYNYNGRNRIVSSGGTPAGSSAEDMVVWRWNGSAWEAEETLSSQMYKTDDRFMWLDLGNGKLDLMGVDSAAGRLFTVEFDLTPIAGGRLQGVTSIQGVTGVQ